MFRVISRRRAVVVGAIVLAATTALAGCSSSTGSSSTFTTDASQIKGNLTFATWWAYANQSLVDGFKAKYPNVKVKLQFTAIDSYPTKLQSQASSGDLPDVFAAQGPQLVALTKAHQLYNLDAALKTKAYDGTAASWGKSFNASLLTGANAGLTEPNGETYGVPFNAISVAAIYNKDVYAKVGITPPTTFAQELSNCTKLSDAGYIPMSLTGQTWIDWWPRLAWDQTMKNEKLADFSVTDPNYVKGFQLVKQMADAKCWSDSQVTTSIASESSLFLQQKTATFVSVPENFLQSVADGAKFQLGTYVLPAMDGKTPNRILGGGNANVLAISAKSKNLSAAVAFAKYLTSVQTETKLAKENFTIPSIDVNLGSNNPLMASYLEAAHNGFVDSSTYLPTFSTAGNTTFTTEIMPNLVLGKITPTQAAQQTQSLFATQALRVSPTLWGPPPPPPGGGGLSPPAPPTHHADASAHEGAVMAERARRNSRPRGRGLGMLLALPAVLLLVLFVVWPIVTSVRYSFTSASGYGDMDFVGGANYARAVADPGLYAAFGRNVVFALVVVAASVLIGFLVAYLLFLRVRGWRPLQVLLMIPYIMPVVVTALLWQFMLEPVGGLINTALRHIGLGALAGPWLTGESTALGSVSLVQIWVTIPLAMLLIFGAMLSLPVEVMEAADLDGAGHFTKMFRIVFPMIRPTIILTAFVITIQLFRSFDLVYLLTKGGPIGSTTIATLFVFVQGFVNNEYGYANAVGILLGIVLVLLALVPRILSGRAARRSALLEGTPE